MSSPKDFLSDEAQKHIVAAIREAEGKTSGEIRVHLDRKAGKDVVIKAIQLFRWLRMHKTEARNGVLIYLAVEDHQFAIIGDEGINSRVPDDFWSTVKDKMRSRFQEGDFESGLIDGISEAGEQLSKYFPIQAGDKDELSNEISFGDD